ncbi:MAG: hypothetical protein M3536_04785 [Actinomycetota bacterium]|nr:hypothetical protein [Actinomycetota bacterium]
MSKSWTLKVDRNVGPGMKQAAARGVALAAEHVLGEAQQRAPIEEGTLGRSGTVSTDPGNLRAAVTFDTPYAVYQHETFGLKHDAGREAKYLENAMNAERATVQQIIAQAIKGVL